MSQGRVTLPPHSFHNHRSAADTHQTPFRWKIVHLIWPGSFHTKKWIDTWILLAMPWQISIEKCHKKYLLRHNTAFLTLLPLHYELTHTDTQTCKVTSTGTKPEAVGELTSWLWLTYLESYESTNNSQLIQFIIILLNRLGYSESRWNSSLTKGSDMTAKKDECLHRAEKYKFQGWLEDARTQNPETP